MTIEDAVRQVVKTSASHTFNSDNGIVQDIINHTEAKRDLIRILSDELNQEELLTLFNSILEEFTDTLDQDMVRAVELIQSRMGQAY